jgi:hypothetical protein
MGATTLIGHGVFILDGTILTDVADGDYFTMVFDADLMNMKVSKDGNAIYAINETGNIAKCTYRIQLGSGTDSGLNSKLQAMKADPAGFALMAGSYSVRVGDGMGKTKDVVYQVSNGIFKRWPSAKVNSEGDTEQAVAVWTIDFLNQSRSIQ